MSVTSDRGVVLTPQGTFPAVENNGQIVPLHYVADLRVLMPKGHWNIEALERVIGEYPPKTVRIFVVLPEVSLSRLRIRVLMDQLKTYAWLHDYGVKLTFYPYLTDRPAEEHFNTRDHDTTQRRISITIITKERIEHMALRGDDVGYSVLAEMYLRPAPDYTPQDKTLNIDALARGVRLMYPLNAGYNHTVIDVHRIAGDRPHRTRYPINIPSHQIA